MSLYIGIMSGTSLDGVDAVLAQIDETSIKVLHRCYAPFSLQLQADLRSLMISGADEIHRSNTIQVALTNEYSNIVTQLLATTKTPSKQICAIGTTGQTIRHSPQSIPQYTVQLLNPAQLSLQTHIDVICGFRQTDTALGGSGAPLSPAFHLWLCQKRQLDSVGFLNLGGIGNISLINQSDSELQFCGFDTGPANTIINAAMQKYFNTQFDEGGVIAKKGSTNVHLLDAMLAHSWLHQPPPKSTGPELFNLDWVESLPECSAIHHEDLIATVTEFSAVCVAKSIEAYAPFTPNVVFVSGGGIFNITMLRSLETHLLKLGIETQSSTQLDIDPMCMEAACFAWYAFQNVNATAIDLSAVTGAKQSAVYGAVTRTSF